MKTRIKNFDFENLVGKTFCNPEEIGLEKDLKNNIEVFCREVLLSKEYEILSNYFGINGKDSKTLKEISQIYKISQTDARTTKERSLYKIRKNLKLKKYSNYDEFFRSHL